jgi:hypothetical protein
MKVVINRCFGGFGLSHEAVMLYAEKAGFTLYPFVSKPTSDTIQPYIGQDTLFISYTKTPLEDGGGYDDGHFYDKDLERNDPILAEVVEELGEKANGPFAKLEIIEIPDDVDFYIDEYDGLESIHESHRSWC